MLTSTATFNNEVQTKEIDFIYDHNGMRTGKIISENGKLEITEYTLHGKLITHLTKRVLDLDGAETSEELHFFYDAQSRPAFVECEGTMYRYIHNLQGDIVAIVDPTGNRVVEYKYDVWGKLLETIGAFAETLGKANLFRYRGYVYEEEMLLYYLRSRYYSVEWCRFISSDTVLGKIGALYSHDLFVYCENNPVMRIDFNGNISGLFAMMGTALSSGPAGLFAVGAGIILSGYIASKNLPKASLPKVSISSGSTTQFDATKAETYKKDLLNAEFYIALGSKYGGNLIYDESNPLSFEQVILALGVTSCVNLSDYFSNGYLQMGANDYTDDVYNVVGFAITEETQWGVYTKNKMAAEGLAYMLGCSNPNEITKGMSGYEHYHDPAHLIHIWYGVQY